MKANICLFLSALLMTNVVMADDLVPATSEDIAQFDRQLSARQNGKSEEKQAKAKKENFGQLVQAEAKKLKGSDQKSDFGKWVSSQRRRDDSAAGSDRGNAGGASADHRVGPGNGGNGAGNGGNANGNGHGRGRGRQ